MSGAPRDPEPSRGPARPATAVVFATAGFFALLVAGLGMLSLALDAEVVATPGLGPVPGVAATAFATAMFALGLWTAVRRRHPSYWNASWIAAAVFLAYLAGLWLGAVVSGAGLGVAAGVAGGVASTWFGAVVAGAALAAAWCGVALVRTRARRPLWPWERAGDD